MAHARSWRFWTAIAAGGALVIALLTLVVWGDDILQALLDPELPYEVYKPPPAPDYATPAAWARQPQGLKASDGPVDVFFVHPTTFDGGRHWNGPITDRRALRLLNRVMLPNYADPFASVGRLFAPLYRQASLYTSLTLFDDAIEAREFAYGDVRAAFGAFRARAGRDRPFIVVGVEQGGMLASRLLRDEIAVDPLLRSRLVAAYLIETVTPAGDYLGGGALRACASRVETGCVVAWVSASWLDFARVHRITTRSVVWDDKGRLVNAQGQRPLCVNPILGMISDEAAPPRLNRGAANASGLEWGARPGFMARQVGAKCVDGILRVSRPRSASLRPSRGWAQRLRVAPYNLFWADLEADAQTRTNSWLTAHASGVSPPR